jgi:two-component system capsular synthesis response regulator RcsB
MFQNVLIAEDHQSMKLSIEQTLRNLGIAGQKYAYYCDDALLLLKHHAQEGNPFDLLITDLSFDKDHREQKITTGAGLIEAAKSLYPDLKILVFSIESNPAVVRNLFQDLGIDGYVRKGREDALDLNKAITAIANHQKFIPAEFVLSTRTTNAYDFSDYDMMIILQLAKGTLQKNIPAYLQQQGTKSSSLSSIEKRLNLIKEAFGFSTNEQLIAYCKDRRII